MGVEVGYLEFVDLGDFEEGFADFGFGLEAGLVDVLAAGFEFVCYGGDGVSCAGEGPDGHLFGAEGGGEGADGLHLNHV